MDLPVELLDTVIEYLSINDMVNLQRSCKFFRNVLLSKMWTHVHLDCSAIRDTKNMNVTASNSIGHTDIHYHNCGNIITPLYHKYGQKNGGYIKCDVTNIKKLCESLLREDYLHIFSWVKVLTLNAPYYNTSEQEDVVINSATDLKGVKGQTLIHWFLNNIVTQKFNNLQLIEAIVDINDKVSSWEQHQLQQDGGVSQQQHTSQYPPILTNLLTTFPQVETNISVHLEKNWAPNPIQKMTFDNLKVLRIVCDGLEDVRRFCGRFLPRSIERFDLVDYNEIDAVALRDFFSKCDRLRSVSLKWGNVSNPNSIDWLPKSVTNLQMCQFDDSHPVKNPVNALNVTYFKSYTRLGQVFQALRFPNLERLSVQGPVDDETPLVKAVGEAFQTSPYIRQLKCRRLKADFVAQLLDNPVVQQRVKSLVVQPNHSVANYKEFCQLAKACTNLDFLFVNMGMVSKWNLLMCIKKFLKYSPNLSCMYIEHAFITPDRSSKDHKWLQKLNQEFIYDDYSKIRVDPRWAYRIDINEFKKIHDINDVDNTAMINTTNTNGGTVAYNRVPLIQSSIYPLDVSEDSMVC